MNMKKPAAILGENATDRICALKDGPAARPICIFRSRSSDGNNDVATRTIKNSLVQ